MKSDVWISRPKNATDLKNAINDYHIKMKNDADEQYLIQRAIEGVPNRLRALILFDGQNVDSRKRRNAARLEHLKATWHFVPSNLLSKNPQFVPIESELIELELVEDQELHELLSESTSFMSPQPTVHDFLPHTSTPLSDPQNISAKRQLFRPW